MTGIAKYGHANNQEFLNLCPIGTRLVFNKETVTWEKTDSGWACSSGTNYSFVDFVAWFRGSQWKIDVLYYGKTPKIKTTPEQMVVKNVTRLVGDYVQAFKDGRTFNESMTPDQVAHAILSEVTEAVYLGQNMKELK